MIKNYQMIEKVEAEYLSSVNLTSEESLKQMGEMYDFYTKYGKKIDIPPEESSHVKTLIKVSKQFASLSERKQQK